MENPEVVFASFGREVAEEMANAIVEEIRNSGLTPVRTGTLLEGYKARVVGNGAVVETDVDYWEYVEHGTSHMRAQPHVGPAIEAVRNRP